MNLKSNTSKFFRLAKFMNVIVWSVVAGALGGTAAGAAAITLVGPIGALVGVAAGALICGLSGQWWEKALDPRRGENYRARPNPANANLNCPAAPRYAWSRERREVERTTPSDCDNAGKFLTMRGGFRY